MALVSPFTAIVPLGVSCQTNKQIERHRTHLSDATADLALRRVSSFFDYQIAPVSAVRRLFEAGLKPPAESEIEDHCTPRWTTHSIHFWHDAFEPPDIVAKATHQLGKLAQLGSVGRLIFVLSNTQSNLDMVRTRTGLDMDFTPDHLSALMVEVDGYYGRRCEYVVVYDPAGPPLPDRIGNAHAYPLHARPGLDWRGDDEAWGAIFAKHFGVPIGTGRSEAPVRDARNELRSVGPGRIGLNPAQKKAAPMSEHREGWAAKLLHRRSSAPTADGSNPLVFRDRIRACRKNGDLKGARAALQAGLAAFPEHPKLRREAAEVASQTGDWREALRLWAPVVADNPAWKPRDGERAGEALAKLNGGAPVLPRHCHPSWAGQGEDRVLERLIFRTVGLPRERAGFYVDIGSYHPDKGSNTRLLHEAGWSGINVDILAETVALFDQARPGDRNINVAIGSEPGEITAYVSPKGPSQANTCDPVQAAKIRQAGGVLEERRVPMTTLDALLDEHAAGRTVDFLNIDVEGLEMQVLDGFDLTRRQPAVIAAEIHCRDLAEALASPVARRLEAHGYRCVASTVITFFFIRR